MPPRFNYKSSLGLACFFLFLYVMFWRDEVPFNQAEHTVEVPKPGYDYGYHNPGDSVGHLEDYTPPPPPPPRPLPADEDEEEEEEEEELLDPFEHVTRVPAARPTRSRKVASQTTSSASKPSRTVLPAASTPAIIAPGDTEDSALQQKYQKEYELLGSKADAGEIFGKTLNDLIESGAHEGFASAQLTPAGAGPWASYTKAQAFRYNPYPDYNGKAWKTNNQGEWKACSGPNGVIDDLVVYSGHPEVFGKPALGSWIPIDLDSNLCFERENRLGPYGYVEEGKEDDAGELMVEKRADYDKDVNWGLLQQKCVDDNSSRYSKKGRHGDESGGPETNSTSETDDASETSSASESSTTSKAVASSKTIGASEALSATETGAARETSTVSEPENAEEFSTESEDVDEELEKRRYLDLTERNINGTESEQNSSTETTPEVPEKKLHGLPTVKITPKSRTAVIIRTHTGQKFKDNDRQMIRALISELCLRSGGEYQVFLLVQVKDDALPIWTDEAVYKKTIEDSVPEEFWSLVTLWNDEQMKKLYPLIPENVNNVHQSQWLSVQKFAEDHDEFDYFWNWEFDARYTGHHYNLLEKLSTWAKMQPRRGLWDRNERFFIPSIHYRYSTFQTNVQKLAGANTVWGPVPIPEVIPVGPKPPVDDPKKDGYIWGHNEEADYISLAPMFNPVNTSWPGRDDVWGYAGLDTPRRATIGTHSRCSKKLLHQMHVENLRGNHVSSEMTPQTVALLHGFKAVFAPIPVYFDRAWTGGSLHKFFNPGPRGVSGSTEESPFSWKREGRFQGATWYFRAVPPQRLWNNWMGWEDNGIGGPEWEKEHGRTCLPPMLLRPIKNPAKTSVGYSSRSDLPYDS